MAMVGVWRFRDERAQGGFGVGLWMASMLVLALVLGGCGSSKKGGASKPVTGGGNNVDLLRALDCREPRPGSSGAGTGGAATLVEPGDIELRRVPADDLVVVQGTNPVSLCDMIRANTETALALYMFTSPSCYKCHKWIEAVGSGLAAFGAQVLPVVILSGSLSRLSDADLNELKEDVATDAIWVRDPASEVWRFFAPESATDLRVSPLTIVMDPEARGFAVDDTALTAQGLVDLAKGVLQVEL